MRRKRLKTQKRIVIVSALSLLLCFSIAYAAFNTQISLKAKGNIKKVTAASKLRKLANNKSSDGLVADTYENGRYFFKGADPNNYITFNGEEWRILSVEYDDTIKIVKNSSIEDSLPFDSGKNSDWSSSSLSKYLNETYVNTLADVDSITEHSFAAGATTLNSDYTNLSLNEQVISENSSYWSGRIGLLTASEYLRANTNSEECGSLYLNNTNYENCRTTNYLSKLSVPSYTLLWTMSPIVNNTVNIDEQDDTLSQDGVTESSEPMDVQTEDEGLVLDANYNYAFGISVPLLETNFTEQAIKVGTVNPVSVEEAFGIVPVVYLKADIMLEGNGTKDDPFIIEK